LLTLRLQRRMRGIAASLSIAGDALLTRVSALARREAEC